MHVGFTGTQLGMTEPQKETVRTLLLDLQPVFTHHGDCIGADDEFATICDELEISCIVHPPDLDSKRAFHSGYITKKPLPYLVRNHIIVDQSAVLIAAPKDNREQQRSGTWATIRYARKQWTKAIYIIRIDGTII